MRMHRIEILQNFLPNPREIYLFGSHLASWQPKTLIKRSENGFFAENIGPNGLITKSEVVTGRSQNEALPY